MSHNFDRAPYKIISPYISVQRAISLDYVSCLWIISPLLEWKPCECGGDCFVHGFIPVSVLNVHLLNKLIL